MHGHIVKIGQDKEHCQSKQVKGNGVARFSYLNLVIGAGSGLLLSGFSSATGQLSWCRVSMLYLGRWRGCQGWVSWPRARSCCRHRIRGELLSIMAVLRDLVFPSTTIIQLRVLVSRLCCSLAMREVLILPDTTFAFTAI